MNTIDKNIILAKYNYAQEKVKKLYKLELKINATLKINKKIYDEDKLELLSVQKDIQLTEGVFLALDEILKTKTFTTL